MSSIERQRSGDVMVVELRGAPERIPSSGRSARTLLKNGPLRATLVSIAPGGHIPEHHADGPITVQPLEGRVQFTALGKVREIGPGQLLSVGTGVRHAVASASGATFLLTVAWVEASADPPRSS
jgi:quercetin dioxygenase-like cupin family protein